MTIERETKTVETPIEEEPGEGGYDTETTEMVEYLIGETKVRVQKIGGYGWSVWEYAKDGDIWSTEGRLAKHVNAQDAHRIAQRKALETSR